MAVYDLSQGFAGLNSGIDQLGTSLAQADHKAQLAALGQKLQAGDYDGASKIAFGLGDVQTGLALQQRKQQAAAQKALSAGLDAALRPGTGEAPQAAAAPGQDGAPTTLNPGNPAKAATQFFISRGYPPVSAAALASGFQTESGFNPSAIAKGDGHDGSDAVNIGQWNGPRAASLRDYARANGLDPAAIGTGLGFAEHELQSSEAPARAALMAARTPEEATAAATSYFRPKGWTPKDPTGALSYPARLATTRAIIGGLQPQGGAAPATKAATAQIDKFQADNPSDVDDPVSLPDGSIRIKTDAPGLAWAKANARAYGLAPDPQDETHFVPAGGDGGGASGGASPQQAAAIAQLPPAARQSVATTIAATEPGSRERLAQLLRLEMLASASGNSGATDAIKTLIDLEKQGLTPTNSQKDYEFYAGQEKAAGRTPLSFRDWNDHSKEAVTYRSLTDPAARAAAGIPTDDAGIYQQDSQGRLIALGARRQGAGAGPPTGAVPSAAAATATPLRMTPDEAKGLPKGTTFIDTRGNVRRVR